MNKTKQAIAFQGKFLGKRKWKYITRKVFDFLHNTFTGIPEQSVAW